MQNLLLVAVALVAGAVLPVQAGFNAKMGQVVGQPVVSALISFGVGTVSLLLYAALTRVPFGQFLVAKQAPTYVWLAGVLGAFFVTAMVLLVPRLGVALTFSLVIGGQMLVSLLIDHYGLLGVPQHPVSLLRVVGVLLIVLGAVLVRRF